MGKGRLAIDRPQPDPCYRFRHQADSTQPICLLICMTVDYGTFFRTNIVLETLLSLVPLIIAVLSTILSPLYIRQRMIQPMKRLTQRLSQLDAASTKLDVIEDQGS